MQTAQADYTTHKVQYNDVSLHVGHWPGAGPAVMMVHGLTANHRTWLTIAPELQAAGYNVFALDLRGRGKSSKPLGKYNIERHAADIHACIEQLGLGRVHLIGHSLGATIGVEVAATYHKAIAKLILMDGGGVVSYSAATKAIQAIKPSLQRLGKIYPNEDMYLNERRASPVNIAWTATLEDYLRYELEPAPGGGVRCNIPLKVIEAEFEGQGGALTPAKALRNLFLHYSFVKSRLQKSRNPSYKLVKAPTLILQASDHNLQPGDAILPRAALDRMLKEIAGARAVVIFGTNHYTIILSEHTERNQAILDFLKD
jgi:pimeloyl-ACP methyl ester carboxylesterase